MDTPSIHTLGPLMTLPEGMKYIPPPGEPAWIKVYHPRGLEVRVPLTVNEEFTREQAIMLMQSVSNVCDAGWLLEPPGLEEGEHKEMIGWVLRRTVPSRSGSCPRVYLYPADDGLTRSIMGHYLNTPQDVADFERASGMKVDQLPVWPAEAAPERGKTPEADRHIVKAPRPFALAFKINPEYKEGDKDKPKRFFSRWPGLAVSTPAPAANGQPSTPHPAPADGLPDYPGSELPHGFAERESAILADSNTSTLRTEAEALYAKYREAAHRQRPWFAHLYGEALHRLLFLARTESEVGGLVSVIEKTHEALTRNWVNCLTEYAGRRKRELLPTQPAAASTSTVNTADEIPF